MKKRLKKRKLIRFSSSAWEGGDWTLPSLKKGENVIKWFVGFNDKLHGEVFSADSMKDATPEITGYFAVSGAFNTKKEAEEHLPYLDRDVE